MKTNLLKASAAILIILMIFVAFQRPQSTTYLGNGDPYQLFQQEKATMEKTLSPTSPPSTASAREAFQFQGHLFDAETQLPIVDARVSIAYHHFRRGFGPDLTEARTDEDGFYAIDIPEGMTPTEGYGSDLVRGQAVVLFRHPNYHTDWTWGTLVGHPPWQVFPTALHRSDHLLLGEVVDEEGNPLAGAKVSSLASRFPDQEGSTYTDAMGRYELPGFHPKWTNMFRVHVEKQGYLNANIEGARAERIVLSQGYDVSGRFLDESGKPVPNAAIIGGKTYHSDARGHFYFKLEPNTHTFTVTAPGFAVRALTVSLNREAYDLGDVILDRGETYTINVVTPSGKPWEGAKVSIDFWSFNGEQEAVTDHQGKAFFPNMGSHRARVHVDHPDFGAVSREVKMQKQTTLEISPGATLRGQILADEPLSAALPKVALEGLWNRKADMKDNGVFVFSKVPMGFHTLSVTVPGYAVIVKRVEVTADSEPLVIQLEPEVAITGIITMPDGSAATNASLYVTPLDQYRRDAETHPSLINPYPIGRTDDAGRFLIGGLKAGSYLIRSDANQGLAVRRVRVNLRPGLHRLDMQLHQSYSLTADLEHLFQSVFSFGF